MINSKFRVPQEDCLGYTPGMRSGAGVHIRRLLFPVYLPMLLLSVGLSAPVAAFPRYLGGLGASVVVVGLVISLRGIGNLASDLPGGILLGRGRLRPIVVVCMAAAAATSAGIALAGSVWLIAVLTLISGTLTSVVVTAMMTYVRLTVPPESRGRALAGNGGALRIGMLIGPALGGVIADSLGVPWVFGLRAVCLLLGVVSIVASPDRAVGTVPREERPDLRTQAAEVAAGMRGRWGAFATVGSAVLVLQLLRQARNVFLPLWGDGLALSATTIGAVISAGAAMDLLLFVPAGIIMDRAGRKVAASICIGVFTAGVLLLPLTKGVAGFVVASMLIGLGNGFGAGINMTLGTDLAPTRAASAFLGGWRLFGDIGSSSGPAIVGALAGAAGLSTALFVTAGIGAVGLFVMAVLAPETLRFAREER
jgi:MFS family permease